MCYCCRPNTDISSSMLSALSIRAMMSGGAMVAPCSAAARSISRLEQEAPLCLRLPAEHIAKLAQPLSSASASQSGINAHLRVVAFFGGEQVLRVLSLKRLNFSASSSRSFCNSLIFARSFFGKSAESFSSSNNASYSDTPITLFSIGVRHTFNTSGFRAEEVTCRSYY